MKKSKIIKNNTKKFIIFVFLAVAIILGIYLIMHSQDIRSKAEKISPKFPGGSKGLELREMLENKKHEVCDKLSAEMQFRKVFWRSGCGEYGCKGNQTAQCFCQLSLGSCECREDLRCPQPTPAKTKGTTGPIECSIDSLYDSCIGKYIGDTCLEAGSSKSGKCMRDEGEADLGQAFGSDNKIKCECRVTGTSNPTLTPTPPRPTIVCPSGQMLTNTGCR